MAKDKPTKTKKAAPDPNLKNSNNPINVIYNPDIEVLETANSDLLNNPIRLRAFFKQECERIIQLEGIEYKQTPKDPEKIYPKLDVFGWLLLLDDLKLHTLYQNPFLFSDGKNALGQYIYNYNKLLVLWDVYIFICRNYGFIPCEDGFKTMTGVDTEQLLRWSSTKQPNFIKIIRETEKVTFISTFRDSKVPIERIYAANNLYKLDGTGQEENTAAAFDVLPDLLALSGGSVPQIDTIRTQEESPENAAKP